MLGRRTVVRAADSLCTRCRVVCLRNLPYRGTTRLLPSQRTLHTSPIRRGLLEYLVGDHRHARIHKEIGLLLEDYDNALEKYYTDATEAVRASFFLKLIP
jgi:hypothetical protein